MDVEGLIVPTASVQTQRVPTILVLGDADREEMKPILTWLHEQIVPSARTAFALEVKDIDNQLSGDEFPDLIIVLQGWSDEYSTADVHHLLSFAPLARVVVCYGSWCESDGRNRNHWPLSIRTPVWAAVIRIAHEWRSITDPHSVKPLPWSASREETFAEDHGAESCDLLSPDGSSRVRTFLVDSPDIDYQNSVNDLLMAKGQRQESSDPDWILFDADPWNNDRQRVLDELRSRYQRSEFALLTNCIDHSSFAEFHQLGIGRIIHKLGFRDQFSLS